MAWDWRSTFDAAGGGLLVAMFTWLLGKSDTAQQRRDDRTAEVALATVRASKEFQSAEVQKVINDQLVSDVSEIKADVKTMNQKLDDVLFGRLGERR